MVKTESVGEARGLMDVMDNCDAVVVAGGDGALTEAVTGLLRRNDSGFAVQRFPIGIILLNGCCPQISFWENFKIFYATF